MNNKEQIRQIKEEINDFYFDEMPTERRPKCCEERKAVAER